MEIVPKIELHEVTAIYMDPGKDNVVALDELNGEFDSEAFNVVVGYSGCGKSTLMKCIAGIEPYDGDILADGEDLYGIPTEKRNFAFVSQEFSLYPHMTVFDNIALPLKVMGCKREEATARVKKAAQALNLTACLTRKPKHISIGQFVDGNAPVVWRGPMLHRAIQQLLGDVFWGDLDVLLLDLPPGTGDVALSVSQLLPNAELLIVTTPQNAAAEVAERAGSMSQQTRQRITGVIENMSAMVMPDGSTMDVFGSGGGQTVADRLSVLTGADVPLLGQVPLDPQLRVHGDDGHPVTISDPESPSAKRIEEIVDKLVVRRDSLAGRPLGLGVTRS